MKIHQRIALILTSAILLSLNSSNAFSDPLRNSQWSVRADPSEKELNDLAQLMHVDSVQEMRSRSGHQSISSEREYLKKYFGTAATGSGNGGDPIALEFLNEVFRTSLFCQNPAIDFNEVINTISVRNVSFRLCDSDLPSCEQKSAYSVKVVAHLNLILINGEMWRRTDALDRIQAEQSALKLLIGQKLKCVR